MITIRFEKQKNQIQLIIKGHAEFDVYGKDLVCGAVSSIVIGGLNNLQEVSDNYDIKIEKGYVEVNSKKNTIVSEHDSIVFETILVQLKTIEAKFPKNVKIEIKEYLWN